jgi:hypothetical protein
MDVLASKIEPELVQELLKLAQKPADRFGTSGLLQELKEVLVKEVLDVETF